MFPIPVPRRAGRKMLMQLYLMFSTEIWIVFPEAAGGRKSRRAQRASGRVADRQTDRHSRPNFVEQRNIRCYVDDG